MNPTSVALVLLAAAVLLWSRRPTNARLARLWGAERTRRRSGTGTLPLVAAVSSGVLVAVPTGWPVGPPIGAVAAVAAWWLARWALRRTDGAKPDLLTLAATWDLLGACLRAGLPVPAAVVAVAGDLPDHAANALRATADLLAMGADPVDAWAPAMGCPDTAALARGARRTARSGTALGDVVGALAATVRDSVNDAAEARAQRAAVLITAPLALCFLPAFVCLGIAPVVVGLASQLSI